MARGATIEIADDESYNRPVLTPLKAGHFLWLLLALPLLVASACEKKKPNDAGALAAAERAETAAGPVDTTPLAGVDASKLDADRQKLFYMLIGSLTSPCPEKAQSLRAAYAPDQKCKRAPFAVKYVLALLEDETEEGAVRKWYAAKYSPKEPVKIETGKAQRSGNDDAVVRLVEFFDYGCGGCAQFRPIIEKVSQEFGDKLVVYYMMYPLGNWPHSGSAAQAAIAAGEQGKFKEMHALLFDRMREHDRDAVMGYARALGLEMGKFEPAYTAAAAEVAIEQAQGKTVGIDSTPAIFINGRQFDTQLPPKFLSLWIQEEIAVNR